MAEPTNYIAVIIGVISAIGGLSGLAALVGVILDRRGRLAIAKKTENETEHKLPAETAGILSDASGDIATQYKGLLEDYQKITDKKIDDLKSELKAVKDTSLKYLKRIAYLMTGIEMLSEQIIGLDHDPCWTPNKWDPEDTKQE